MCRWFNYKSISQPGNNAKIGKGQQKGQTKGGIKIIVTHGKSEHQQIPTNTTNNKK